MQSKRSQKGFTLMEVLVTLVILSVGLLGLAGLQGYSLRNSNSAYLRTQASVLAYTMIDRMRSNPSGSYASYSTATAVSQSCEGSTVTCTDVQLSSYDKAQWRTEVQSVLPGGVGTINDVPDQVTISWTDKDGTTSLSVSMSL
ncbi:MAG: type IV pilus modification protein PilV [Sedimenticola sp.]